jgi:hypothetical protein
VRRTERPSPTARVRVPQELTRPGGCQSLIGREPLRRCGQNSIFPIADRSPERSYLLRGDSRFLKAHTSSFPPLPL